MNSTQCLFSKQLRNTEFEICKAANAKFLTFCSELNPFLNFGLFVAAILTFFIIICRQDRHTVLRTTRSTRGVTPTSPLDCHALHSGLINYNFIHNLNINFSNNSCTLHQFFVGIRKVFQPTWDSEEVLCYEMSDFAFEP